MNQHQPKTVVVTGAARGIGRAIREAFEARGDRVTTIDLLDHDGRTGDIADRETLEDFAAGVIAEHGGVDILVNNACLSKGGLATCGWEDFNYVLRVGVAAPFYLAKLFREHFRPGASIVNISSTRQLMSQADTESYSAAKGGIGALTHALAASLAGKVRVNSISPGWIDTTGGAFSGPDAIQHPAGRVGRPEDIAAAVLFLCDPASGFITGQNLVIDGGMSKLMVYHGDAGWSFRPD